MPSKSIQVAANGNISFFIVVEQYSIVYYIFFIYSSVDWHLDCFHILTLAPSPPPPRPASFGPPTLHESILFPWIGIEPMPLAVLTIVGKSQTLPLSWSTFLLGFLDSGLSWLFSYICDPSYSVSFDESSCFISILMEGLETQCLDMFPSPSSLVAEFIQSHGFKYHLNSNDSQI